MAISASWWIQRNPINCRGYIIHRNKWERKTRQILSFNKSFGNLNLVNQGKAPELSKEIDKVNTALGTEDKRAVNFINITEK